MKLNNTSANRAKAGLGNAVRNACVGSCQKVLRQITRVKEAILTESFKALATHERLLRLALNEAEAAAWQTMYPHLVFPTLATEKVQAVIAWNRQQQTIRRSRPFGRAA